MNHRNNGRSRVAAEQNQEALLQEEVLLALKNTGRPKQEVLDVEAISEFFKDVAAEQLEQRLHAVMVAAYDRLKAKKGMTYKRLASRLGIDPSVITRRFNGQENMTIRTIAEMFLALESEVDVSERPVYQARKQASASHTDRFSGEVVFTWHRPAQPSLFDLPSEIAEVQRASATLSASDWNRSCR